MQNRTKTLLIVGGLLIVIIVISVSYHFATRMQMNPPGTTGNLAGNLYNGGLFAQRDERVYFANAFDQGTLYVMNADESQMRKIHGMSVENILIGKNRLYYYQPAQKGGQGFGVIATPASFVRSNFSGNGTKELYRGAVIRAQLYENSLYLLSGVTVDASLTYMETSGVGERILAKDYIDPACVSLGTFYYANLTQNFALYAMNAQSNPTFTKQSDYAFWNPIVDGEWIYYMDPMHNYRLCRYHILEKTAQFVTEERVDCFNVAYGYIYYQTNDAVSPGLYFMTTNELSPTLLAQGNYTALNMTSWYVYFQQFGQDTITYHAPLGSTVYETFYNALEAADN
ncbi:MAG: DUF5050 domain-containing protein [Clostridium sp.]|jgi:hypothetical protein|nr:DUF5050 domain-containing protein [Clostridium sp.]